MAEKRRFREGVMPVQICFFNKSALISLLPLFIPARRIMLDQTLELAEMPAPEKGRIRTYQGEKHEEDYRYCGLPFNGTHVISGGSKGISRNEHGLSQ
jgi:hypothetical protein